MNGLEAIELMKQEKVIKMDIYLYRFQNGVFEWNTEFGLVNGTEWREENGFDLNSNDYEEYIEPKLVTGWHVTGEGKNFFWIDGTDVDEDKNCFEDEYPDDNRFATKEKAEEINFKQTLFRKLQRFSDENGGNEVDWNDEAQDKYYIRYYHGDKKFMVDYLWRTQDFGGVYFISKEVTEQAIELFHDDLIKYFTQY